MNRYNEFDFLSGILSQRVLVPSQLKHKKQSILDELSVVIATRCSDWTLRGFIVCSFGERAMAVRLPVAGQ